MRSPSQSALLHAQASGKARIHGLFGGQGNNKHYFDEIRVVWDTYAPLIHDFIASLSSVLHALSQDERVADQYPHGLDVLHWLRGLESPESIPDDDYLISAPVSFPLIGLLQLAHTKAVCMSLGVGPEGFSHLFGGLAGHSQGVVVAAAVATASDWASFLDASVKAVTILFWVGSRCQQVFSQDPVSEEMTRELESGGHGKASPMLSVVNIQRRQLRDAIEALNQRLPLEKHASIALVNSISSFVVSGPERTLAALIQTLHAPSGRDSRLPARVPYSQRKPSPATRFLPITIPCHSPLLDNALPLIDSDLRQICSIPASTLRLPVNKLRAGGHLAALTEPGESPFDSTSDADDGGDADLTPLLVRLITSKPVEWAEMDFSDATHIIDFGPGGTSGAGALTHRNLVGSGARVIIAEKLDEPESTMNNKSGLGSLAELLSPNAGRIGWGPDWAKDHQPSLVRAASGVMVGSKLSRLLGLPPIMVAGMTPTTTRPEFVAAVMNAGYHVEFAAGGYHSAEPLRSALFQLRDLMPAGRGITINVIYAAPKAIAWQIPFIRQLRAEGFPVTGLTVGGGVPTPAVAAEYIHTLGLEHISFKPGSTAAVRQVVEIARENPSFPIILQWTGGRGGGHHSAEDMYAPLLETYAELRSCDNLVLVAGSGFGCAADVVPFLDGSWSRLDRGGGGGGGGQQGLLCPMMPFDGALLGSRVMTCAEALTSPAAKQAIAASPGVRDEAWEGTYNGPAGGVMSIVSEMGEPIHVIATRGAQLWAHMDKIIFSLDRKKRPQALAAHRDYIIARLNADFQRPWFGKRADGTACDVSEMTYEQVARRLVELMFIGSSPRRWIDASYVGLVAAFLTRIEERFRYNINGLEEDGDGLEAITSETACQSDPLGLLEQVLRKCPLAATTLVMHEEVDYFMQLCRRPGQKPVPFVPALDDHFETWFKKDSLWQSEDTEAVVGGDADRTLILHGPVVARHTCRVDEPVQEVLDGIHCGIIDHFKAAGSAQQFEEAQEGDMPIPEEELVQVNGLSAEELRLVLIRTGPAAAWPWRSALFGSRLVVQGRDLVENPVRKLVDGASAHVAAIQPESVTLFTEARQTLLRVSKLGTSRIQVLVFAHVTRGNEPISLALEFEYWPETPYAPIWEVMQNRNERIGTMYRQLWQSQSPQSPSSSPCEGSFTIDSARVRAFNRAIGYTKAHQLGKVPMDFAIVVCWAPICSALLQDPIQGDVLNLVHLSNSYEVAGGDGDERGRGSPRLKMGDELQTRAYVKSVTIEASGKVVQVGCEVRRGGPGHALVMTVYSSFLFRGSYTDFSCTFAHEVEKRLELNISNETDIAILDSKPWFHLDDKNQLDHLNLTKLTLEFHLETTTRWRSRSAYASLDTTGRAYIRSETGDLTPVGTVDYRGVDHRTNAVLSYLRRRGRIVNAQQTHSLRTSGSAEHEYEVRIPPSNETYSRASGDFNPIHVSPLFARLTNLPGTITHGMYCSAVVRQVVEKHAASRDPDRIRNYKVSFVGMVLPGDVLKVSLCHSGMQAGLQVIDIAVTNTQTGVKVLTGSALVAQPSTTVVFTGQGSQKKGMGQQLYASSPVARSIWDRAEAYFESQFGVSILDIVRNNPKEIKVHFGGVRGRMLRQNYLSMCHYEAAGTGTTSSATGATATALHRRPIFPTVTQTSSSYTHSSPSGLLFSTQFAQPALTIMELAAFKDMEARGVVDAGACRFAGHSLGEYAALLSTTGIMSLENLLNTVFCRGMTMQDAVERDEHGRSGFAMVAVDPSRVRNGFSESALRKLVEHIQAQTGFFIEIVNLNIRNRQYVCAGDLRALDVLQRVCDDLKERGGGGAGPLEDDLQQALARVTTTTDTTTTTEAAGGGAVGGPYAGKLPQQIQLKWGVATVPLAGVDVPFHSSLLRPRMNAFRRVLQESLNLDRVRPQRLVGKYIPNITGAPFALSREYFESVYQITASEALGEVLDNWEVWGGRMDVERGGGAGVAVC
ncbi:beta subunit of fatty acid synthetase [Chaetomidium leptoderma]|uniref:Beta subunit of fatty acid synthetase n=1 Tax=Chaetomidium leptoderma TaxID=669021 RepID=A0AAN6ZXK1_9PEZI|nr:beta subunit of fatty acid synthetase [Chaetomidium leptoderma]